MKKLLILLILSNILFSKQIDISKLISKTKYTIVLAHTKNNANNKTLIKYKLEHPLALTFINPVHTTYTYGIYSGYSIAKKNLNTIPKPINTSGYYIKGLKILKNNIYSNIEFKEIINKFKNKNKNLKLYKYNDNTYHIWSKDLLKAKVFKIDINTVIKKDITKVKKQTKLIVKNNKLPKQKKNITINVKTDPILKKDPIISPNNNFEYIVSLSLAYLNLDNKVQNLSLQDKLNLSTSKVVPAISLESNLNKQHFILFNYLHYNDSSSKLNNINFTLQNKGFKKDTTIYSSYKYSWFTLTYLYQFDLFKFGIATHIINSKFTVRNVNYKVQEDGYVILPTLNISKDYLLNDYKININASAMKYNFYTYTDLNTKIEKENIFNSKYNFISQLTLNKYNIDIDDDYEEDSKNIILYFGINRKF